jgi:hypothetical protein
VDSSRWAGDDDFVLHVRGGDHVMHGCAKRESNTDSHVKVPR